MTQRIAARLSVAFVLLVPVVVGAQTFAPRPAKPDVPSTLSITLHPGDAAPARLKYMSGDRTLDAQGATVTATLTATGLIVDMHDGTFTGTDKSEPWQYRGHDTFKTLRVTFAPNGDMVSFRISKD